MLKLKIKIHAFFVTSVILACKGEDLLDFRSFRSAWNFSDASPAPETSSVCFVQLKQGNDIFVEGKDSVTESKDRGKYRGKNFYSSLSCVVLWVWFSGLNTCAFLIYFFICFVFQTYCSVRCGDCTCLDQDDLRVWVCEVWGWWSSVGAPHKGAAGEISWSHNWKGWAKRECGQVWEDLWKTSFDTFLV